MKRIELCNNIFSIINSKGLYNLAKNSFTTKKTRKESEKNLTVMNNRKEISENNDIESIQSGLCFTGILVNAGKISASKAKFWQECNFNILRNDNLFDTKKMELFKNKTAENIIDKVSTNKNIRSFLVTVALRHKEISDTLKQIVSDQDNTIKQVIILGSGFDLRATDYKEYPISFTEIDNKAVLTIKEAVLRKNAIDKNATYIAMDYIKDDLIANLVRNGVDLKKGTHFIWEGNSMYIPRSTINNIWSNITYNFKGPLSLSMDYLTEDFVNNKTKFEAHKQAVELFKKLGATFVNGFNDVNSFANANNFKIIKNSSSSDLIQDNNIHNKPLPELMDHYVTYMTGDRCKFKIKYKNASICNKSQV